MKEKTFEELIDRNRIEIDFVPHLYIPIGRVESLLQLVREATIAECIDKISELHGSIYKGAYKEYLATNMPTDRIKLTEK